MRGALEVLLLRHGESEGNRARAFGGHGPTPLTAEGRAEAEATGHFLAAEGGLVAIYSSDLVRAVETAAPVARATQLPVSQTPALRERSVGVFTGLSFEEAALKYPDAYAALLRRDPNACPPEGERSVDVRARLAALFDEIVTRHPHGKVLLVSHAHALNLLVRHVLALPDDTRAFFQIDNCAIHRLERLPENFWRVVALNDRRHLR